MNLAHEMISMPLAANDADLLRTIGLVVRRYCELFDISDPEEKADIITRVLVMFESGVKDGADLMAKLLAADDR